LQTEPYLAQAYEKIPQGFALRLEQEHKTYPVSCDKINISKFASSLSDNPNHLELGIKQSAVLQLVYLARYANLQNDTKTAKDAYSKALQIVPSDNAIAAEAAKIK
jgi:cytochrome c-type biogenesis protein CcmH/NrfG